MMHLVIAQVDKIHFEGEADSATFPGMEGEMTVLQNHEPLITTLKSGIITVRQKDIEQTFEVSGGVLEVRHDGATVIL